MRAMTNELVSAFVLMASAVAVAAPVRYENTTQQAFGDLDVSEYLPSDAVPRLFLDVTLPAEAQPGAVSGPSVFASSSGAAPGDITRRVLPTLDSGAVVISDPNYFNGPAIAALSAGDLISATSLFSEGCSAPSLPGACDDSQPILAYLYDGAEGGLLSMWSPFPSQETAYIGLRFELADGVHYGYLEIVRNPTGVQLALFEFVPSDYFRWADYDLIAWAYETQPGVAIVAGAGSAPCPADFNSDGTPGDIFDLFDFLSALDGGLDFNADTSPADIFDLFDFLAVLDAGCP